jgi:ribosome-associated protein
MARTFWYRKGEALTNKSSEPLAPAIDGEEPRRAIKNPHISSKDLIEMTCASLEDDQGIDIVRIDLAGKSSIADYMVVTSGTSQRHVSAMADHLVARLKKAGADSRSEGKAQADWILIDAGDVIVHIFRPEIRDFYNLEKMWSMDIVPDSSEMSSDTPAEDSASGAATS